MNETFNRVEESLRLPGNQRSEEDLRVLQDYTRNIEFFIKLNEQQGNDELHRTCCKVMELQSHPPGKVIFKYGDQGDFFFIILKGTIALFQPKRRNTIEVVTDDPVDHIGQIEEDGAQQIPGQTADYSLIARLEVGSSFGELALLKDFPRSATAQCLEETCLAVIKAYDFNGLLAAHEDAKITQKAEFLGSLPFLRNWTKVALFKLTYCFRELSYKLNQIVYKEGSPADEVFIIRSGEFKVAPTQFSKQNINIIHKPIDLGALTNLSQTSAKRMLREHQQSKEENLWMMIKGPNEMFGDYDVIEGTLRQNTCICSTRKAEVYVIHKAVRLM